MIVEFLGSVVSHSLSGSTVIPAGYTQSQTGLRIAAADGNPAFEFSANTPSPTLAFDVPVNVAFGEMLATATASAVDGKHSCGTSVIDPATSSVSVHLLAGPDLIAPAATAAGVSSATLFSWSAVDPSCVYRVQLSSPNDGSSQITLFTTATTAGVPADAGLTAAASYTWSVTSDGQRASSANLDEVVKLGGPGLANITSSLSRPFVAQ